jgi:hypothetical protein
MLSEGYFSCHIIGKAIIMPGEESEAQRRRKRFRPPCCQPVVVHAEILTEKGSIAVALVMQDKQTRDEKEA